MRLSALSMPLLLALVCAAGVASLPMRAAASAPVVRQGDDVVFKVGADTLTLSLVEPNVLHVHVQHAGATAGAPTLVIDPAFRPQPGPVTVHVDGDGSSLSGGGISVRWDAAKHALRIADAQGRVLLTQDDLAALGQGRIVFDHAAGDTVYGIHGYNATDPSLAGIVRQGEQVADAGKQGHAGAPFAWSTAGYGVLVDARPAQFQLDPTTLSVSGLPAGVFDYYVIVGAPPAIFAALSALSGPAPLFPKWSMGFINSQWGIDQQELLDIVHTYRAKRIPLDGFVLDFDWKAWGQDDYGEFRWNAQKFPGGPDGKLKAELDAEGVHLGGIMKPRIHVDTVEGRYATAHNLWFDAKPAETDYFSHKPVRDLDFDKPATRAWFFNPALKHAFDTGIVGWWNDEADDTGDGAQFMNMQRALYDGQRAYSPLRVWSINRNFYLGAQRYAYGLWSGDIDTGFKSMAAQRERMLSAIALGEWNWGMDGGGFHGHPSDENYARWIEFGAFTPIFRVHGDFDEKRQPWKYGPVAEAAATAAIRLRYRLLPYIYSYQYDLHAHGVGLVRPLAFVWPHDPAVRNDVAAWMFGAGLLVSPVVEPGQTRKSIYLPPGTWTDWFSGKAYQGGRTIELAIDAKSWADIPLFIRQGAIIPLAPPMQYVGQTPMRSMDVEVFPAAARSSFDYYNDDGTDYAYEHGAYRLQSLAAQREAHGVSLTVGAPQGSWHGPLQWLVFAVHGIAASGVDAGNAPLAHAQDAAALRAGDAAGWASGQDRYGEVTWVKLPADQAMAVTLH